MEYYPAIKNEENLPWMDLESLMLNEMSEKDRYCMMSLMCRI